MDAGQFLSEFGHIANAPGSIPHLRQMIYQLAISGSLTPRGENEKNAAELLSSIQGERQRLVEGKKYKRKPKLESESIEEPKGIKLPATWCWSRLLDLGEINPRNSVPDDQLAAFVPMRGISQTHGISVVAEVKRWGDIKKGFTHFANGDVVLAKITPCFENGKAAVIADLSGDLLIGAGTTELQVFRPIHDGLLPEYVYLFLRSPHFRVEGERNMTGTAGQKRVPTDYFATRAFPLPPTEEQARIVEKVNELMSLCDQLEWQQQGRRNLQDALRKSILQAVTNAKSRRDLRSGWERIEANFAQLFSLPQDIQPVRAWIYEVAVRGFLTEQIETESPAANQLAEIRHLSGKFVPNGRRKRTSSYQPVSEEELDYETPKGWAYARLGELVRVLNGRAYSKTELLKEGTPVLRVGNLFTSKDWYYSNLELEEEKYCDEGDLLYAWSASFGPFIWSGPRVIFHYHIWKIVPFSDQFLDRDFLFLVLQERTDAIKASGHGISMTHMTKERMEKLPIAVPPIDEQKRIVERVARLTRLCDQIEIQLRDAGRTAEQYAVSAIFALNGINVEPEEDTNLKAPKTELIAPIRLGSAPEVKDQAPLATLLARYDGEMPARDLWQRFGGEIDAFYAQLKTEVAHGWIAEPAVAEMLEKPAEAAGA